MRFQRRQLLSRVSIQSKLVVMLVLCTIVAATVVGVIGFRAGRASLRDSVLSRLTELRQSQSRELKDQLSDLKNSMIIYARGAHTQGALAEFTAGFDALADKPIGPAQSQSINDYYTNTFLKQVQESSGAKLNVEQLLPQVRRSIDEDSGFALRPCALDEHGAPAAAVAGIGRIARAPALPHPRHAPGRTAAEDGEAQAIGHASGAAALGRGTFLKRRKKLSVVKAAVSSTLCPSACARTKAV